MTKTKRNQEKGFTLVELLAVIVILAIILVIAVPKVMDIIADSKKATLETTAKMIAGQAEKKKIENEVLGKSDAITCESVAKYNNVDYAGCSIKFDGNTAKVTIEGANKFEGLWVCNGSKTSATATDEECSGSTGNVEAGEFGKDSWETIVAAVQQAYDNGEEYPYNVGDEKEIDLGTTLGTHTIRVANTTKCSELDAEGKTIISKTACGFVLEFSDIIESAKMNDTSTNAGGWPASKMRTYVNSIIYNALPEVLRTKIIDTYVISSAGSGGTTGYENVVGENFYSTDKLYLLSTYEVWGSDPEYDGSARDTITRQLDYYKDNSVTTSSNNSVAKKNNSSGSSSWWWLRSASSDFSYIFYSVSNDGNTNNSIAYGSNGLAPAFRLAD